MHPGFCSSLFSDALFFISCMRMRMRVSTRINNMLFPFYLFFSLSSPSNIIFYIVAFPYIRVFFDAFLFFHFLCACACACACLYSNKYSISFLSFFFSLSSPSNIIFYIVAFPYIRVFFDAFLFFHFLCACACACLYSNKYSISFLSFFFSLSSPSNIIFYIVAFPYIRVFFDALFFISCVRVRVRVCFHYFLYSNK
jgi:hypothetical protein